MCPISRTAVSIRSHINRACCCSLVGSLRCITRHLAVEELVKALKMASKREATSFERTSVIPRGAKLRMQQRALVETLAGIVFCDHAGAVDHAAHYLVNLLALHIEPLNELIKANSFVTRSKRKEKRPQSRFFDPYFKHGLDRLVVLRRHLAPDIQIDDTFEAQSPVACLKSACGMHNAVLGCLRGRVDVSHPELTALHQPTETAADAGATRIHDGTSIGRHLEKKSTNQVDTLQNLEIEVHMVTAT
jgi:hypothetical protein